MQVKKTLVLWASLLMWGPSNAGARTSSPPDVVYPTTQDQEALDQLLKQSGSEPDATAAPTIPAPTTMVPTPEATPTPPVAPPPVSNGSASQTGGGVAGVAPTVEPAEEAPAKISPPHLRGRTEVGGNEPLASPSSPPSPVKGEGVVKLPEHYSVWIWQENGDCLWRIAEKIYGDRDKWRLIYLANRDVIQDPNKIYPKQKLRIPPADWQP